MAPLLAVAGLLAALVVAPGAWDALAGGTEYSTVSAALLLAAAVAAASLAVAAPQRRASWLPACVLGGLLVVKIAVGAVDVPRGWLGEYTMATPSPAKVGSFRWRLGSHPNRIDRELIFRGVSFDFQFLNDFHRYNGPSFAPPRATSQALRMTWTGWLESPDGANLALFAQSAGLLEVSVDGRAWATAGTAQAHRPPEMTVGPGRHLLTLTYHKPAGVAPAVFARVVLNGHIAPITPWPTPRSFARLPLAALSDAVVFLGLAVLLWQFGGAWRGARVRGGAGRGGALIALVAVLVLAALAAQRAGGFAHATYELRPGDDHLAYEGLARNILEEGLLMPEGRAPGDGTPFFFYPLYSYALAGAHVLLGDGYAVVVLLNGAAAASLPVLFWLLGWRKLSAMAQLTGQVLLGAFILRHNAPYFESPLTDNLFIPLVFVSLVVAARSLESLRVTDAFASGCTIAACATARPSFFLFMAPYSLVVLLAKGTAGTAKRLGSIAATAAGYAAALSPVVARNWIMAGQPVAMVTLSHAIPLSLIPPEAPGEAVVPPGVIPDWSTSLRLASAIILADPWGVAWLELRKILFTLGFTNLGPGNDRLIWEFPLLFAAGVAALLARRLPKSTAAVVVAFVASHLAAITIAYPWTYGYKTILPVHLVFLFCAMYLLPARDGADSRA